MMVTSFVVSLTKISIDFRLRKVLVKLSNGLEVKTNLCRFGAISSK